MFVRLVMAVIKMRLSATGGIILPTLLVLVSCYSNTEVAEVQHAKFEEAHDHEDWTEEDFDNAYLMDNIFDKPFKISYTIQEGDEAVDPYEVERKLLVALETWLDPLREYIGADADKIVTASDIVFVNETGNYTHGIDEAYRKEEAGKRESLTVVHVMQHIGGFVRTYHRDYSYNLEGTAARADVYLKVNSIHARPNQIANMDQRAAEVRGQRVVTHEFGHMFMLDDTYLSAKNRRGYDQDEINRACHASLFPNREQPYAPKKMFNRHTGKLHSPSLMQCTNKDLDNNYPGDLSPDDVCGIVEVYADRHLAKNGTKRRDLYKKMQDKLMEQYGFECVWSP